MRAIVRDAGTGTWRLFERPKELVVARVLADVIPSLRKIESACANGAYAAGFLAYEAAPAFDPALRVRAGAAFPLLWFGLYDNFHELPDQVVEESSPAGDASPAWTMSIDEIQYTTAFNAIQELIRNGDTYQVNFTTRLRAEFPSSPWALFQHLASAQDATYGAYIHAGEWVVCSGSPELFFERQGTTIVSKPMKGTAARGLWFEQDIEHAERLRSSEKERAENVMIVDMVRNDLGRIATAGSVHVPELFDVKRYSTLWQMTSTVVAETSASLTDVIAALFPPASITGAPKSSTMGVIADLECSPRHIYTGTIGFIDPGGRAQFNVAIRTALVNRKTQRVEYGVGGGIVADSTASQEFAEAELKAKVLKSRPPAFDLLETMLWTRADGYLLLDRHIRRLMQSAEFFGFHVDARAVEERLDAFAQMSLQPMAGSQRVRLLVSRNGALDISATMLGSESERFGNVELAADPVDPSDPFLYHKTTNRGVHERALASRPGASDVLLFNTRDELTESTIANVVVEIHGSLITPPIASGLLPGVARARLLEAGRVSEGVVRIADLAAATRMYLMNSVRGMHEVALPNRLTDSSAVSRACTPLPMQSARNSE